MPFFKLKEKRSSSDEKAKSILSTYRNIWVSTPNYVKGDYISLRSDTRILNLNKNCPSMGYALDIQSDNNCNYIGGNCDLTIAYVDNNKIKIGTIDARLYRKMYVTESPNILLIKFVEDKPIDDRVDVGSLVRPRYGLEFVEKYYDSPDSSPCMIRKILNPCMVLQHKNNKVTIVGCIEKDMGIIKRDMEWYKLAFY